MAFPETPAPANGDTHVTADGTTFIFSEGPPPKWERSPTVDALASTLSLQVRTCPILTGVAGNLGVSAHSGKWLRLSGNVTVPHAAGSKGFFAIIEADAARTVTFNGTTSPAMAAGDVMTVYVLDDANGTPTIDARPSPAADKVVFS